jgi:hypothetical protein
MSIPEPLDEHPAGAVEIRGGDKPEDFIPDPSVRTGSVEELLGLQVGTCGPDCDCDEPA